MKTLKKHIQIPYEIYRWIDDGLIESLKKRFKNVEQTLGEIISPIKISRYEKKSGYTYFALLIPDYNEDENIVWKQTHIFIENKNVFFVDEDFWNWFDVLDKKNSKISTKKYTKASEFFCDFMDHAVSKMFDILAKTQLRIEIMEQSIFQNIPNNDKISEIQSLKKIIINFKSVLLPLYEVFDEYAHDTATKAAENESRMIESILRKIKKLIENLDNFHDISKLLRETNETLIARSTNETVKRLTLFNALLLWPSLIAAFFGMNIHFGWFTENATNGEIAPLFGIIVIMFLMAGGVYLFFRKKNWI